jgi:hypothetical protein
VQAEERSFPLPNLPGIDFHGREWPHDAELSRDNLRAAPDKIKREACLSRSFLDSTSDADFAESEKTVPLHDAARHLACPNFQALVAKFHKLAQAGKS